MSEMMQIEVTVNGARRSFDVATHHTLLDVLRDDLELTGTKECCVVGECGACTVMVDGRSMNSCLMLAVEVDGSEVTTVEGLAEDGRLNGIGLVAIAVGLGLDAMSVCMAIGAVFGLG